MQIAEQASGVDDIKADIKTIKRQNLLGMSFDEVEALVTSQGLPRFRAVNYGAVFGAMVKLTLVI